MLLNPAWPVAQHSMSTPTPSSSPIPAFQKSSFPLYTTNPPLRLKHRRPRRQNHHQATHNQPPRDHRHHHNAPPGRRKLAANNIMLGLKIPVKPNKQHQNRDTDKRRAQRLAQVPQLMQRLRVRGRRTTGRVRAQRRVEAKQLRDSDSDGSEGQTCAEPSEESAFCWSALVWIAGGRVRRYT